MICCFSAAAAAGPAPADFEYCSDVQSGAKADSLYQVHLSEEILRKSAPDLHDLRLFDSSGKETAFAIIENVPPYEETPETYHLEITGYQSGPASALITMKLPEKHQSISLLDLENLAASCRRQHLRFYVPGGLAQNKSCIWKNRCTVLPGRAGRSRAAAGGAALPEADV
jgi:hypothetical protein